MRKIGVVLCFGLGVAFTLGALYSLMLEPLSKVVVPEIFARYFCSAAFSYGAARNDSEPSPA